VDSKGENGGEIMFNRGIIASIQPRWNSLFNNRGLIASFAVECGRNAVALRICGAAQVEMVKEALEKTGLRIPIIGITKQKINALNTLITPTFKDAETLIDCGADYVAMECSDRVPTERIVQVVNTGIPVIADIGDKKHMDIAYGCGVCAVTTALSGYLNCVTHPFVNPDFALVKYCAQSELPVIAEGRYRIFSHMEMAKDAGAYAICIGNTIHEPRLTTLYAKIIFDGSWKELAKSEFRDLI
jgi:N-acylglucosamine-6-phosphate 2-epimerase